MNPNRYERWILLDQSGELSAWRKLLLRRALARHPGLRAWRDEALALTRTAPVQIPPLPDSVRDRILEEAKAAQPRLAANQATPQAMSGWAFRTALAGAAAALIIAAVWILQGDARRVQVAETPAPLTVDRLAQAIFGDETLESEIQDLEQVLLLASLDQLNDNASAPLALEWMEGETL